MAPPGGGGWKTADRLESQGWQQWTENELTRPPRCLAASLTGYLNIPIQDKPPTHLHQQGSQISASELVSPHMSPVTSNRVSSAPMPRTSSSPAAQHHVALYLTGTRTPRHISSSRGRDGRKRWSCRIEKERFSFCMGSARKFTAWLPGCLAAWLPGCLG